MKYQELTDSQQKRIEAAIQNVPYAALLGIKVETVGPGTATMTLEVRDDLLQNNRVVHGGAIASLVDSAAAFAVIPLLADDETATTVDLTVTYLRPLVSSIATASAKVLRKGSRIIAISVDVVDDAGHLAATGLTTYLRLAKRRSNS